MPKEIPILICEHCGHYLQITIPDWGRRKVFRIEHWSVTGEMCEMDCDMSNYICPNNGKVWELGVDSYSMVQVPA